MTDPRDITHLLYSAKRNGRSVADELQVHLTADRESVTRLVAMFETGNLRPKQAEMARFRLEFARASVSRHEDLLATYASLRAPGALPPVHKSSAPCEPEIVKWAEKLASEVDERVWEFLYGQQEKVG